MTETYQEPKRDWGFYAQIPRIVRTQYKQCSHAEKWLYTCLKDLCGDKGTCFRSLRLLSAETDISTGSLSVMIPHLHEVGLIHAEKKKRTATGKEIWHISIVDIWKANTEYCSKNEQSSDDNEEIVQNSNDVVQKMNDNPVDCSKNERDCSNFVDRRITIKNNNTEEETREEKKDVTLDIQTPNVQVSVPSQSSSRNKTSTKKTTQEKLPPSPIDEEVPFEKLPWNAEKALMILEKLVEKKYRSRDKELKACMSILQKYKPTEDVYLRVVGKILPWYQEKGKLLHPTDLAAKTQRGHIRFEELLEEIEYQDSRPTWNRKPQPTNPSMTTVHGQRPEDYKASPQARSRREQLEREWAAEDAAKAAAQRGA